jgi:hypothetical protein
MTYFKFIAPLILAVLVGACSEHEPNHISVHSKKTDKKAIDENKKDANKPVKSRKVRSHKNIRV